MKEKVLVTGSTGFVGKHLCKELIRRGYRVFSLVYEGEPYPGTEMIRGDITDRSSLKLPDFDVLFHCAGILESSHQKREVLYRVNTHGTENIVVCSKRVGVKKIIFMSTISAVGPQGTSEKPITEQYEPKPNDDYGLSKLKAERFLEGFHKKNPDIDIGILRPPVVYGYGMNSDSSAMKTFTNVKRGRMPLVHGGKHTFNFLYVENLIYGMVLLMEKIEGYRIFNINEGPYKQIDVVRSITKAVPGSKGTFTIPSSLLWLVTLYSETLSRITKRPPFLSWTKYRALSTDCWNMDHGLLKEEIGYEALYDLEEGVRRTANAYRWV